MIIKNAQIKTKVKLSKGEIVFLLLLDSCAFEQVETGKFDLINSSKQMNLLNLSNKIIFSNFADFKLSVGTELITKPNTPTASRVGVELGKVINKFYLPIFSAHALQCCLFLVTADFEPEQVLFCKLQKKAPALAWLTLSDKGFKGERQDQSGFLIESLVQKQLKLSHSQGFLLPDDKEKIMALFTDMALVQGYELIIGTGGTGVSERDVTPEATLAVIEKRLPAFEQAMVNASLAKTIHSLLSRAVVGTIGRSLLINLPGSPKAVSENLQAILPAFEHTLAKLSGDMSDCNIT